MQKICTLPGVFLVTFLTACSDPSTIIHESSENSESSQTSLNCIASSPCQSHEITLWNSAETLRPETPFDLFLDTQNPALKVRAAWLEGKSMYMGKIPVFFTLEQNSRWSAEVMVGACSDPVMEWLLTIELTGQPAVKVSDKTVTFSLYTTRN